MWWKVVSFCLLVCVVLFIVLSCISGRPATHLLLHRCCEEGIENDEIIMENFRHNFLRERLIATKDVDEGFVDMQNVLEAKVTVTVIGGNVKNISDVQEDTNEFTVIRDGVDDSNKLYKKTGNVHNINDRKQLSSAKTLDERVNEFLEEFTVDSPNGSSSGEEVTVRSQISGNVPSI